MTEFRDALQPVLPDDAAGAALAGRVWRPDVGGPSVVAVRDGALVDISAVFPTMRDLCEAADPAASLRAARGEPMGSLEAVVANTPAQLRDRSRPWLLSPIDLQAIKAAGVTFVASMIERVIEERARGDLNAAAAIRAEVNRLVGDDLAKLKPGSPEAERLKQVLIAQDAWSQYLEVGIGPDAEIFTKAQPMAAVGSGMDAGIHPKSSWNNPEPEVVLAVSATGRIVAATLGNDVNLRDVEGRSALLLGKAKDNNASCAIGPFLRFFDARFTLDDIRRTTVSLSVAGTDGFRLEGEFVNRPDQSRPSRSGGADGERASSLPGRRGAVPRHHVRTGGGPRRTRQGLHAQDRGHRDDRGTEAGAAGKPHDADGSVRGVDLRRGRTDAQPRPTRGAHLYQRLCRITASGGFRTVGFRSPVLKVDPPGLALIASESNASVPGRRPSLFDIADRLAHRRMRRTKRRGRSICQ